MKIYLLTHEREVDRPSNTGSIALSVAGGTAGPIERIVWSRANPSPELVQVLKGENTGLLYPLSEADGTEIAVEHCDHFVLLDATWQEARKMFNRSPYLHSAGRVNLQTTAISRYQLRRNQKPGGLCTAECVVEILRGKGKAQLAAEIEARFLDFNARN
ncbi:DTW domain-containing protein [Microbulbifer bruguierae]|uniref:tRNA-uridine aminocarboxypropyltransferase n=1 Tax=Microbulbifer bruguierae TaxID=3029061 RepID=A0ABY8NE59_9GAMM|nr:tRNA-uridine aminocarboxypropyltransferase [Microbulbifer bruguierae]WGL15738.1 DTW domain-containing protein [Microbulbifer bruguierae]